MVLVDVLKALPLRWRLLFRDHQEVGDDRVGQPSGRQQWGAVPQWPVARTAAHVAVKIGMVSLALSVALGSLGPAPASAFSLTGAVWKTDQNGNNCGPYSGGVWNPCVIGVAYTSGFRSIPDWENTANAAAERWARYDSGQSRQVFRYDTLSGRDNVRVDAADLGGYDPAGSITLGDASWSYWVEQPLHRLYAVDVKITTNGGASFCTQSQYQTGCPSPTQIVLEQTVVHEYGHALGLNHPVAGPNSWAVMQCFQARGERSFVRDDDVQGQMHLYGGSSSGTPGATPC